MLEEVAETSKTLGAENLLIADVGTDLYSDFNKDNTLSRDEMKELIAEAYAGLSAGNKLTLDGANAYLLPYTNTVINIPLGGSNFYACSREVPFLPMVLQGYVNYTGKSINLSHNERAQFLNVLEYGAIPLFTLNWSDATILKDSNYSYLSGTKFSYNMEDAVAMFKEYQAAYEVVGSGIKTHTTLSADLVKTEFESGTIIINYSEKEQIVDGVTIQPESYHIVKGAK